MNCHRCKKKVDRIVRYTDGRSGDHCMIVFCHGQQETHRVPLRLETMTGKQLDADNFTAFSGKKIEEYYLAQVEDAVPLSSDLLTLFQRLKNKIRRRKSR